MRKFLDLNKSCKRFEFGFRKR